MKLLLALLTALALPLSASAQTIHRLDGAQSSLLIERDDNGYSSCGIRVMVPDTENAEVYDLTLRVAWKFQFGLLDAKKIKFANGKLKKGQEPNWLVKPTPNKFWIVKETEAKALRPMRYGEDRTPGVLLAGLPLVPTFGAIIDIYQGQRMQFALSYPGRESEGERAISFKAPLSKDDQVALKSCIDAVANSILDELKHDKPAKQK